MPCFKTDIVCKLWLGVVKEALGTALPLIFGASLASGILSNCLLVKLGVQSVMNLSKQ